MNIKKIVSIFAKHDIKILNEDVIDCAEWNRGYVSGQIKKSTIDRIDLNYLKQELPILNESQWIELFLVMIINDMIEKR